MALHINEEALASSYKTSQNIPAPRSELIHAFLYSIDEYISQASSERSD